VALTTAKIGGKDVVLAGVLDDSGNTVNVAVDVLAHVDPVSGKAVLVSPAERLPARTIDETPGYAGLTSPGVVIAGGDGLTVLAENDLRMIALVQNTGLQAAGSDTTAGDDSTSLLWVSFDPAHPAAPGVGELLRPGLEWYFWTPNAITVFVQGPDPLFVTATEALPT
jgi:hypothetical protein